MMAFRWELAGLIRTIGISFETLNCSAHELRLQEASSFRKCRRRSLPLLPPTPDISGDSIRLCEKRSLSARKCIHTINYSKFSVAHLELHEWILIEPWCEVALRIVDDGNHSSQLLFSSF
jgi:hypothetical protein